MARRKKPCPNCGRLCNPRTVTVYDRWMLHYMTCDTCQFRFVWRVTFLTPTPQPADTRFWVSQLDPWTKIKPESSD